MNKEYWLAWLKAAAIRAAKTAAQVGIVLIGSDIVNIVQLDWPYILGCMAAGFVVSMLTSVAGLPEVEKPALDVPKGEAGDFDIPVRGYVSAAADDDAAKPE